VRLPDVLIRRYLIGVGVASGVVTADLLTKRYASVTFEGSPVEILPGLLGFTYVENSGGAFGFFQDGGTVIGVAALVVTLVVIGSLVAARPTLEVVALGLVLGGALGNLVDRLARGEGLLDGAVIDWINLWIIPTFNLADASISVAVGLLLIQAWRSR
jgi:signal peptidase II